ncbi:MAG: thioredoxin [Firmicutes bacterium]|nr:thioredoxin [Bacillota bacterium]
MALTFTDSNFQAEVLDYNGVVLVDFWAPWCGPCQMVAPFIEEIAEEYQGKAKVGKLNTDENPESSSKYNILTIPTMLIFKNGEVVDQINGALPKNRIAAVLDRWV